jgi:hypothetical protein
MRGSTSWRKSSFSEGPQTNCVEVAFGAREAAVRDSKNVPGPVVSIPATAWRRFVAAVSAPRAQ